MKIETTTHIKLSDIDLKDAILSHVNLILLQEYTTDDIDVVFHSDTKIVGDTTFVEVSAQVEIY